MKTSRLFILTSLALLIGFGHARAASFTIDDAADSVGPIGDFYLVTGNIAASSPGQVYEVLGGPGSDLQNADPEFETRITDMGDLWSTLSTGGITSASRLVFGFGINQTGSVGSNFVDVTDLTMTFGGLPTFSLDSNEDNTLRVYNYVQGQSTAEVRIGVDLGFDFMTAYNANSTDPFTIFSSITGGDDGFEIYFLSSAFTADENLPDGPVVPEPASLLLLGTGLAFLAIRFRRGRTQDR